MTARKWKPGGCSPVVTVHQDSGSDHFHSALIERTYRAKALSIRVLKSLLLLSAYQGELCETRNPALVLRFHPGRTVQFSLCLQLLRLMVSAILLIRLGRLPIREFQFWVASCGRVLASPVLSDARSVCDHLSRKVIAQCQLRGLGWCLRWTNYERRLGHKPLELSHIFSAAVSSVSLPETLSPLEGHHMLVKTDNTSTVSYIIRQGGLRACQLHMQLQSSPFSQGDAYTGLYTG